MLCRQGHAAEAGVAHTLLGRRKGGRDKIASLAYQLLSCSGAAELLRLMFDAGVCRSSTRRSMPNPSCDIVSLVALLFHWSLFHRIVPSHACRAKTASSPTLRATQLRSQGFEHLQRYKSTTAQVMLVLLLLLPSTSASPMGSNRYVQRRSFLIASSLYPDRSITPPAVRCTTEHTICMRPFSPCSAGRWMTECMRWSKGKTRNAGRIQLLSLLTVAG